MKLNKNITLFDGRAINTKASEEYVHVKFKYPDVNKELDIWVPVEYRRTGISISCQDIEGLEEHLNSVYEQMHPSKYSEWKKEQEKFWNNSRSVETKEIFNILSDGEWHCRKCDISNPNFARRIQELKEMGYTLSTHLNYHCPVCNDKRGTRLMLLPIDRVQLAGNGYETWSNKLRKRIIEVLGSIDVYEDKINKHCLPDHKFSEIRWDNDTKSENPDTMTDEEIREKFQLLSNQRNQQKREVCRNCFQTGERGTIFGIKYFYEGSDKWDTSIPKKGKEAEKGCKGCPWYDIAEWRKHLKKQLE